MDCIKRETRTNVRVSSGFWNSLGPDGLKLGTQDFSQILCVQSDRNTAERDRVDRNYSQRAASVRIRRASSHNRSTLPVPVTLPSHIVRLIQDHCPQLAAHTDLRTHPEVTFVAGVLAATKQLSPDFIPTDMTARFTAAVGALEQCVRSCDTDIRRRHLSGQNVLDVRNLLEQLPDEPFRPDDSALRFIDDAELQHNLGVDIAAAHRALAHGEWKAATVLAGSVIEALVLWAINEQRDEARVHQLAADLQKRGIFGMRPPTDLLKWYAHQLTEVAFSLGLLSDDTIEVVRTAKDYRNLIHPGREQRTGQRCTQGTALVAVGAVMRVIEDLQRMNRQPAN